MSARSSLGVILLALLSSSLAGCLLRASDHSEAPPTHVSVRWSGSEHPYSISAATLPVDDGAFAAALDATGAGLRVSGGRPGLTIRHASLDEGTLALILERLGRRQEDFSRERSFDWGDDIKIDFHLGDPPSPGSFLQLRPFLSGRDGMGLAVGAVVRPADGAVFPVLQGRIHIDGPGPILMVGEAGEKKLFALVVRLVVPGAPRTPGTLLFAPVNHRLEALPFECDSDVLSATLDRLSLDMRGSAGGFAVRRLPEARVTEVHEALEEACDPGEQAVRVLASGDRVVIPLAGVELSVETRFSRSNYTYESALAVTARAGAGPLTEEHGEQEGLLALLWDVKGPGRSVAILLWIRPVE